MAEAKPKSKGAAPKARKKGRLLSTLYTISGERMQRKNKFCPKCGPGMFMAGHAHRLVCGKCRYVEFGKKV